ncbi:MAG: OmpA family protein [Rhizomicrobium sp.]
MKRIAFVFVAFALAGCLPGYPPPPVARYYPPPSRPAHRIVVPKPRPEEANPTETAKVVPDKIKPLSQGKLTALSVGDYMDGQEKDLRTRLRGSGITVSRIGDNLVVNIRSDRLFEGTAPTLSQQGDETVRTLADSVRRFDSTTLSVKGFTDAAGAPQREVKMSQTKADVVDHALVANGVDPHRISAKGFGAGDLKVPNGKDARNRRIEIDITPRVKT